MPDTEDAWETFLDKAERDTETAAYMHDLKNPGPYC